MGKGRDKTKKSAVVTHDENGIREEEKLPVKQRGRPTKAQKEAAAAVLKIDENQDTKIESSLENGRKRNKPSLQTEEGMETVKDVNGVGPKGNSHELTNAAGFRQNGSRRKNKPRRAAEVGVSACEACSWLALRS